MYQVMLVEDSEVMLKEIRRLKCWRDAPEFVVSYEARNGYEALQQLTGAPIDLVITDIRMPKVNGLELLQKIKERELAKAVIIISEYQEFNYARQGMVLGAFDYLVKPVTEADLIECLARVAGYLNKTVARQSRLQQLEEQAAKNNGAESLEYEIDKLVMEVVACNLQAKTTARNLILFLNETMDRYRTSGIIQKTTIKILSQLKQAYPWVDNFIALESGRLNFFKIHDPDRLVETFTAWIVTMMGKLDKLIVNHGNNTLVKEVCIYVLNHVDQKLTIQSVANALFVHRSYLSVIFRQQTGKKLNEYLHIVKLERAQKLLAEGSMLNYQIAGELGFKDVIYFGQIFKKYTGMSPSEYKQL